MLITKLGLLAAGMLLMNASHGAPESDAKGKIYQCGPEEMTLKELDNGRLELKGKNNAGYVFARKGSGQIIGEIAAWELKKYDTTQKAVKGVCQTLLRIETHRSHEEAQKEIHEFYESLE